MTRSAPAICVAVSARISSAGSTDGCMTSGTRLGAKRAISADQLPISPVLARQPRALQLDCALGGGDDYELLFTAPPQADAPVRAAAAAAGVGVRCNGRIEALAGLRVVDGQGRPLNVSLRGFDHFAGAGAA